MRYLAALALIAVAAAVAMARAKTASVDVTLQVQGDFAAGSGWSFVMGADRTARLTIDTYPKKKRRALRVSERQLAALRRELEAARFFELGAEYGDLVPDSSVRTLTVREGARRKTVRLKYLRENDPRRAEVRRALRVWHLVRAWFSDPAAVDLRRYDGRILRAR